MNPIKAWLITWEWTGNKSINEKERIAAIVDSCRSQQYILDLAKFIYAKKFFNLEEQISYASNGPASKKFWQEFFDRYYQPGSHEGIPVRYRFTLGSNPYLYARLVKDLKLAANSDGEPIKYTEIQQISKDKEKRSRQAH